MTVCKCPGESQVGFVAGFSGNGHGQTKRIAVQNAYKTAGVTDTYSMLASHAFRWECDGDDCIIRSRFKIDPKAEAQRNEETGLWTANLDNATLTVWVECSERTGS